MKVLLVGGTGVISSGVTAEVLDRGMELWLMTRGKQPRNAPEGTNLLVADCNDEEAVTKALEGHYFDVVVHFCVFNAEQMRRAAKLFAGHMDQFFVISSGTVYKKPLANYLITEDVPLGNIHSAYARNKLAVENVMREAIVEGFPGIIIRPSLTYSEFHPLMAINSRKEPYSIISRMRKGKPVVVHGDGTSLWTITYNRDLAKGLVGLFGNKDAIGEAFHITSDEVLDWDRIYMYLAHAAGVDANLVHIASDYLGTFDPALRESLLGDHACSAVFDNSKIKKFVPDFKCTVSFEEGAKRIVEWFDADPKARETVDPEWDAKMDMLIAKYQSNLF